MQSMRQREYRLTHKITHEDFGKVWAPRAWDIAKTLANILDEPITEVLITYNITATGIQRERAMSKV